MKILFLHGWTSKPGGVKPTYLARHGHEVVNPALPDEDLEGAVRIAQEEYDRHRPDVIVGSSRGGAVAMNLDAGETMLVLLCPAWKRWGSVKKVKAGTVILHSEADEVIPFEESRELVRKSGLAESALVVVGRDHRLADAEALRAMLEACEAGRKNQNPSPPAPLPKGERGERYGFLRTVCGCEMCRAPCRHVPGSLDVADLERLCPPGQDILAWAEEHLRALTDKAFPTLVPARQSNGHCHWLYEGKCVVHDHAPYSCAFFDSHMAEAEVEKRSAATIQARREDADKNGLYHQVWLHLCRQGLTALSGDRAALKKEMETIRRTNRSPA